MHIPPFLQGLVAHSSWFNSLKNENGHKQKGTFMVMFLDKNHIKLLSDFLVIIFYHVYFFQFGAKFTNATNTSVHLLRPNLSIV